MVDIEQNLDAYRILAQILGDLRASLQAELEERYGEDWFRSGLPRNVLDRLVHRKETEQTIDWYESEYQQIIDFASFEDILEVLEGDEQLLPQLRLLAPSPPLLHARLMEMEVMRQKLALARGISENELVFLGTLHLRFQKILEQQKELAAARKASAKKTAQPATTGDQDHQPAPASPAEAPPQPEERTAPGAVPTGQGKKKKKPVEAVKAPMPVSSADEQAAPGKHAVEEAMEEGDHRTVLRALYREVTAIAEGLWNSEVPTVPSVWEKVREHDWYEQNFSSLGLKPLSDFYDVIDEVHVKMHDGIAKDQLQDFLKEHNFAKVLLALRDMFQKNRI